MKKRLYIVSLLVGMLISAFAQKQIEQYEYWFDNNAVAKTTIAINPTTTCELNTTIPTTGLPVGLHTFQARFKDNTGIWSSTSTHFFVKQPSLVSEDNKITKYEYWFDNNYNGKATQIVTAQTELSLVTDIAAESLPAGLHTFQIRFQSASGKWSSTTTQFFVKPNLRGDGENTIVGYEYWFNDSINKRTSVKIEPINPLELKNKILPVNDIIYKITKDNYQIVKDEEGNNRFATINRFYIRFQDINGLWSSVTDTTFKAIIKNNNLDFTPFITNPNASEGTNGWTTIGGSYISNDKHWSGTSNSYFSLYKDKMDFKEPTMTQSIIGLPAGTYVLKAIGVVDIGAEMSMSVGEASVDFPSYGYVGGEIWENASEESIEKNCNNGKGFGWSSRSIIFTTDGNPVVIKIICKSSKIFQIFNIDHFTLSLDNAATLDVFLPDNVVAANYKDLNLLLTNKTTGAKISLTTTGKETYTFNGLTASNYYCASLLTSKGAAIATIDSIKIISGYNSVKFTELKAIVPVILQVLTPSKVNVTKDVTIQWYNGSKQFLAQGDSLPDMTEGTVISYSITPNQEIGTQFKMPKMQPYTVTGGTNNILCTLQKIDSVTITGTLKDENKWAIAGGSVAITQWLNGKYPKNFTTLTDKNGKYTATVFNDSSTVILCYSGYISSSRSFSNFNDTTNLGTTILQPITGLVVTTNLSYTTSVAEGVTATTDSYYSDYQNIEYQLYNLTKGKAISKFNVQYPSLIIQDFTSVNDQIRITATSKTSDFSPVTAFITVDKSNKDTVNFELKQMGAIKATYSSSSNSSNVGVLYNAQGQLVKKDNYSGETVTFSNLRDGDYTLVSIAGSTYFSAISNLSDFTTSGLKEGTDYALNAVTVKTAVISTVSVTSIPALDETKFYYTGTNTSFTANKTSVTAGNYITLRAKLDFKGEYTDKVSNVSLIVDVPDSCAFVKNSVMVGTSISAYIQEGNRITIPLNNKYTDQVRFCITPAIGGKYYPTASIQFSYDKKTVTQPIGSASFTAENMSIVVPEQTAKKMIPISGAAPGYSVVTIYDGTTVIGQTTALPIGTWATSCELYEAYNLTTHNISAQIQTLAGNTIYTETKSVNYNISAIEVKTVTMLNTAHGPSSLALKEYSTVFDFQHPNATLPPYWYWPSYPDFTFKIDFTNNDTSFVSDVTLYVKTSSEDIISIPASYDKTKDIWVATRKFTSYSLPVNLSVDYTTKDTVILDREYAMHQFNNNILDLNNIQSVSNQKINNGFNSIYINKGDTMFIRTVLKSLSTISNIENYDKFKLYDDYNILRTTNISQDSTIVECIYPKSLIQDLLNNKEIINDEFTKNCILWANNNTSSDYLSISTTNYKSSYSINSSLFRQKMINWKWVWDQAEWAYKYTSNALEKFQQVKKLANRVDALRNGNCSIDESILDALRDGINKLYLQYFEINATSEIMKKFGNSNLVTATITFSGGWLGFAAEIGFSLQCMGISNNIKSFENFCPPCTDCPKPDDGGNGGGKSGNSGSGNTGGVQDPSGYVYEAVSKNRLEGVTATIYYKTDEVDMYGDKHEVLTKWDAASFLQVNPQITDENGVYAWDVPDGLWQVKYEKAGYETMFSDWLPVPPPQLDINVGMKHLNPPTLSKVRGYEEGINIRFDKYMKPATMTTNQISVVKNGVNVSGTVRMLNEEEGYASDTAKYVSKVRFVPDQTFIVGDKVTLTVKSAVESYAGMKMASDYTQLVEIEKEVKAITSDSLAEMKIHGNRTISVSVLPASAAKGKTILANSASSSIVTLTTTQAILDDNGKANFIINGDLPGGTTVQFTLSDVDDLSAVTNVNVSLTTHVYAPIASITSGATVTKDTTVILSCSTSGATIYYTTDGTSPSIANGSRKIFKDPISIFKSITIQAIAVKAGFDNSEVVSFSYIVGSQAVKNVNTAVKSIKLYPNPAKNNQSYTIEINANDDDLKHALLTILSLDGKLVLQDNNVKKKMMLNALSQGCYIVHVRLKSGELLRSKLLIN